MADQAVQQPWQQSQQRQQPSQNTMSREIGSLRTLANGESQYVGSSSGVYFINTVRRAFAQSAASRSRTTGNDIAAGDQPPSEEKTPPVPSPEDCLVGGEQRRDGPEARGKPLRTNGLDHATRVHLHSSLSSLPDRATARQLILTYFRIWHPLVPFLHGPSILGGLDALYNDVELADDQNDDYLSRLITYKCIFSIAALDYDNPKNCEIPVIKSAANIFSAIGPIAMRCDIHSIQALLSAQLYFIATMALRSGSSVGGLVTKAIVQSGMHRCPYRYWHLTPDERTMRKRLFWSAYVLDRFLSQSLGHPLGFQDSDIDVCLPGSRDLHEPVAQTDLSSARAQAENTLLHLPTNHPERAAASPRLHGQTRDDDSSEDDDLEGQRGSQNGTSGGGRNSSSFDEAAAIQQHRHDSQAVLEHHVHYTQLIGRMLEIYHKSIRVRGVADQNVVFLKADVSAFGNMMAPPHQDPKSATFYSQLGPDPTIFPLVSYKYARLLINRPSLSLDPQCADFRNAIQVCVGAATSIVQILETYAGGGGPLFWPGYMAAVWMSGLVLAFAARVRQYPVSRAVPTITSSLELLTAMTRRWRMAAHCKEVLASLLDEIRSGSHKGHKRARPEGESSPASQVSPPTTSEPNARNKRRQANTSPADLRSPASHIMSTGTGNPHSRVHTRNTPGRSTRQTPKRLSEQTPGRSRPNAATAADGPLFDATGSHDSTSQFYDKYTPQLSQPDFNFDFFTTDTPGNSADAQPIDRYSGLIPTTFPDRYRGQQNDGLDNVDYFGSTYNIFDGATWGPLVDLLDETTTI